MLPLFFFFFKKNSFSSFLNQSTRHSSPYPKGSIRPVWPRGVKAISEHSISPQEVNSKLFKTGGRRRLGRKTRISWGLLQ
jgi:hypothetical protein